MLLGQARGLRRSNVPRRVGRSEIGDVDDQRIEARPALGFVDAGDGAGVRRVGGEAVDRLGRHRDRLPVTDQRGGGGDRLGPEWPYLGALARHAAAAMAKHQGFTRE